MSPAVTLLCHAGAREEEARKCLTEKFLCSYSLLISA
jgi:hypothetical protein